MKLQLPKINNSRQGFTLIELLVVIAIIAILAVISFAAFSGLTGRGNDSRRQADIKSIADAYEVKRTAAAADYSGEALAVTDFSGGALPSDPVATRNYCVKTGAAAIANAVVPTDITALGACAGSWTAVSSTAFAAGTTNFKVCVLLADNLAVKCVGSKQ